MKWTSVASRVQGHDRAAVLELAVMAEDDVQQRLGVGGGEAVDPLDLTPHAVIAERDLAEQLAGVGQLDRAVDRGVGLDLADVVQQRAGDRDVAVDPGKVAASALTPWATDRQCSSRPWR